VQSQVSSNHDHRGSDEGTTGKTIFVITLEKKNFLSKTRRPISIKRGTNHPWVKEFQVSSIKRPGLVQRGDTHNNAKIGWGSFKIFFSRTIGLENLRFT
jgi:hypothetical protein